MSTSASTNGMSLGRDYLFGAGQKGQEECLEINLAVLFAAVNDTESTR